MNLEQWTAVDRYVTDRLMPADPVLEAALHDSTVAGLPSIAVSAAQGKFLQVLAQAQGARRILEMGTLGGYSTILLARALPLGGKLITLEAEPKHAEVARVNIARAGLDSVVELRLGPALETLPVLAAENGTPFDYIFIDADKPNIPEYFAWAILLARPGGMIIVDNVVRSGALADAGSTDASVLGVRRFHEMLAKETRVSAMTLQTVGNKGYDGLTFAVVLTTR